MKVKLKQVLAKVLYGAKPIPFQLTFSSSITDISIRSQNCYYIPLTNTVHIEFAITSSSGKIPVNNNTIATVPANYSSGGYIGLGMAFLSDSTTWNPAKMEAAHMSNRNVVLGNWIYGNKSTYMCSITGEYIANP